MGRQGPAEASLAGADCQKKRVRLSLFPRIGVWPRCAEIFLTMRLLIHDYAGHPFQIQLSRELARRGHTVLHAFAGELQTPRGELTRRADDAPGFSVQEVAMDPDYAKFKYSFRRRRSMEIAYGRRLGALITEWKPDAVLSANTPTETQQPALDATKRLGARFLMWQQDFYSIAVDKLVRKKIPVLGP